MRNLTPIAASIFLLFWSCQQRERKPLPDFFNPDVNISVEDLKGLDFVFVKDWSMYNLVIDSPSDQAAYMYQCRYDQNPVINRIIDIDNWTETDSTYIADWVDSKGGILISNLNKAENDLVSFYVMGKHSGQISQCEIHNKHLTIKYYFPDTERFIRSEFRKFENGQFYTECYVDGKQIIYSSDGILGVTISGRTIEQNGEDE